MATGQENINLGTADNANDGDVLRAAFRKVKKMFAEIYGDTDAENLTDTETVPSTNFDTHITEKIEDTVGAMFSGGTQTNVTVTYDDSDGTIDLNVAADITDVNAGSGLTGVNEDGGAATLNVGAGTGITVNADDVQITDGGVDATQLADRYTEVQAITTTSGTINLDASSYSNFRLTSDLTGATTLNIQNMVTGQVIDITVSGSQTITFSSDDTSETFNKVGGVDYDGAEDNHIQVVCIDDTDSAAIYNYAIGTYTSDTTP